MVSIETCVYQTLRNPVRYAILLPANEPLMIIHNVPVRNYFVQSGTIKVKHHSSYVDVWRYSGSEKMLLRFLNDDHVKKVDIFILS